MKELLLPSVLVFFFLFFAAHAYAVSINIINPPTTITSDPFTLTASISGATTATNYLRVDIYKEGASNYFGETYNGSDWYGGSTYSQYFPISIQSGVIWNGNVQGRVGSPSLSDYDGTGTYKVRVRRYTSSGGYTTSEASASAVTIAIAIPTNTPTPAPATSTPTNPPPTNSPTPSPTKSLSSTFSPTPSLSPSKSSTPPAHETISPSGSVLGASDDPLSPTKKQPVLVNVATENIFPKIMMGIGIVFMAVYGILSYLEWKKQKKL